MNEEPNIPVVSPVGERGPKGDHGQEGHDGDVGRDGRTGIQGERGPQGDHGQAGEVGLQGIQGEPGRPGESIGMLGFISRHAIALTFAALIAVSAWGFQQAANSRNALQKETRHAEMVACAVDQRSWTQRHAIIVTLTKPNSVERQQLLDLGGKRPSC